MKIQTVSRTFRLSPDLDEGLLVLARSIPRHPSDLIRDAIRQYVNFYKTNPKELAL
jgi:predicted transcriptional regulator